MLNLLIIDKDINNSIYLLNYISENGYQIRVHSIVKTLNEGIKLLNTGLIDITLININDSIDSIISRLHTISSTYSEKYKKSVIVVSEENTNTIDSDFYVCEYISPSTDLDLLFLKINIIAKNKGVHFYFSNLLLTSTINNELEYIGYNLSYTGTKYLSECIALMYGNYKISENLNKNIYPIIAQKHNKNINNIKCNIMTATNSMFYECSETKLQKYFNTSLRPGPKSVICTVLNKLYNSL